MASPRLVNLLALMTLAILVVSFNATPVTAVSVHEGAHHARSQAGHHALAKKKRQNTSKRCKQRTSSLVASSTPAPASTSKAPAPETTPVSSKAPETSKVPETSKAPETTSQKPTEAQPTTTKATSAAATPTQNTNTGSSGGGKAGIAWNNQDTNSLTNFKTGRASAIYTWSPYVLPLSKQLGFTTMSMLWGWKQVSQFVELTSQAGYADWAMGPNEPNEASQSNMSPGDAANLYRTYISPLKAKGYKLVGPACTSAPSAIDWYKQFLDACDGCIFDSLALHWYGTSKDEFISYVQSFHATFPQYPLMVTEYACQNFSGGAQCSQDQIFDFTKTVTDWMDGQDYILYYFQFGVLHDMYNVNGLNQLLGGDGKPTALGSTYLYG